MSRSTRHPPDDIGPLIRSANKVSKWTPAPGLGALNDELVWKIDTLITTVMKTSGNGRL